MGQKPWESPQSAGAGLRDCETLQAIRPLECAHDLHGHEGDGEDVLEAQMRVLAVEVGR